MSTTTEAFIQTFEKIKAEINRRAGAPDSFEFKLDSAANKDHFIKINSKRLRYIRDVRDLLQHPQNNTPERPFSISVGFLQEAQTLLARLTYPPAANDIWVGLASLTLAQQSDRIGDLVAIMKTKGYSHLPILNNSGAVIGVFNEAAVFAHL